MAEINLLPNDLRDKEEKERATARRKSHAGDVSMSQPTSDRPTPALSSPRPSLMSKLFSKRLDQPKKEVPVDTAINRIADSGTPLRSYRLDSEPEKVLQERSEKSEVAPRESTPVETPKPMSLISEEAPLPEPEIKKPKVTETGPRKHWNVFKREKNENAKPPEAAKNAGGLDVNLIPVELAHEPELDVKRRLFIGGLAIFVSAIIVVGIYLGMTWYQVRITYEIKQLEAKITALDADIERLDKDKKEALDLQERLALIRNLIDQHTYWTKFFELLEKNTVRDVYYTNFAMAGTDSVTIAAVGKDYRSVAEQLVAFEQAKDFIKDVRIDSASSEIDGQSGLSLGVTFNINLEFVPGVFNKPLQ